MHLRENKVTNTVKKAIEGVQFFWQRPLYLLVVALSLFTAIGVEFLEFTVQWADVAAAIFTAVVTEYIFSLVRSRSFQFPASALIAALGISIFFRASNPWYFALAAFIAIASKYVIKVPGQNHIFNPSNLAVVSLAFLFPANATIEFTQWGNSPAVFLFITLVSLSVAYRARVLLTTFSFLFSYTVLLIGLLPFLPQTLPAHHYGLIGPSLMLFASFMITDPKTMPTVPRERVLHGIAVAALFFVLEIIGIRYSLLLSLFLVSSLSGLIALAIWGYEKLARRTIVWRVPKNIPVFTIIMIGTVFSFTHLTQTTDASFSPRTISPKFLFMGIESDRLRQCAALPTLIEADGLGVGEQGSSVYGASWGDFNQDGYDDLYIPNASGPSVLYRNDGGRGFTDVTQHAGLPHEPFSSALWLDYDNDGYQDLFLVELRALKDVEFDEKGDLQRVELREKETTPLLAYENNGDGTFTEVTTELGLDKFVIPNAQFGALSAADYDNDGLLDLTLVTQGIQIYLREYESLSLERAASDPTFNNWLLTSCEKDKIMSLIGDRLDALPSGASDTLTSIINEGGCMVGHSNLSLSFEGGDTPTSAGAAVFNVFVFQQGTAHVLENTGNEFVERPSFSQYIQSIKQDTTGQGNNGTHPYPNVTGFFYQPLPFDYDSDGAMDLFISSDFGSSVLLRNEGDFSFLEQTSDAGLDFFGQHMGTDVADYNNDGALDLFVDSGLEDYLYKNNGDGTFTRTESHIGMTSFGWGASFIDYDLDGDEDLMIASGNPGRTGNTANGGLTRVFFRTSQLYENEDGSFKDATWDEYCPIHQSGRGLAISDYDNDGDIDTYISSIHLPEKYGMMRGALYKNHIDGSRHFLKVQLIGVESNRDAIGAIIEAQQDDRIQRKPVLSGSSFYSQDSKTITFGFGEDDTPVDIHIYWPSGQEMTVQDVAPDQTITIVEGRGLLY